MNKMEPQIHKQLFDQNPDAIALVDLTGGIKDVNVRFIKLFNASSLEFHGSNLFSFFLASQAQFLLERFNSCVSGEVESFDAIFLNAQRREIAVGVSLFPVMTGSEVEGIYCILKEVRSQRIQEQELEQAEHRDGRYQMLLNAIVENAEEGIAVADLDGHFIIYNRAMVDLLGVQQTDSKAYDWSTIYNIHDPETGMIVPNGDLPIVRAMKGDHVRNQVYLIKNPIRGNVYLSISSSSIKDIDGNTIASIVIDRDITDQITYEKKLNAAIADLERSNLRFQYASEAVSDAIWDLNLKTSTCYWGEGFKTLFGHEANYYTTDADFWIHYIHPDDRDRVFNNIQNAIDNPDQNQWEAEFRFRKADNTFATVADKAIIIRDDNRKAFQVVGAMQDVSRLRLEEQRLKLLESVITNTSVGVLIVDIDILPGLGPRILYVNEAFTSMTGYEQQDVLNGSPRILYGEHTDQNALNTLWQAMKEKRPVEIEFVIYTKNAEELWVHMHVVPVQDGTGAHSHFVSLLRDITDRKTHELEKEQFIKGLTQSNKELKQFTYITSHNLRSPLVNLMGLLHLIDDYEVHDQDLIAIHEKLKVSTESLISTVNDLMDILYTKDHQFIQMEENDVAVVLGHVLKLVGKVVAEIEPEIICNFNEAPSIKFHKAYFESILMNLLTNAIKYRSPTRKLKICVSTKIQDDRVVLTFKDNGIGFDLERHKDRVFGFYQKFHNHPDSKGLGLFLVKSQMEDLGGTVEMESFPDAGTTLILRFKQ